MDKLEWLELSKKLDEPLAIETFSAKFMRKFKENPFVPIGSALTVAALSVGLYNLYLGRSEVQQRMMRARVIAQGLTIAACFGGFILAMEKKKKEEQQQQQLASNLSSQENITES